MYSKNLRACSSLYPIKHSDITTDVNPGDSEPYYLVLADKYSVDAPAPPSPDTVIVQVGPVYFSQTGNVRPVSFSVPAGYWISSIIVDDYIGTNTGTTYLVVGRGGVLTANTSVGVDLCAGHGYLWQQSGTLSITLLYTDSGNEGDGEIFLNVNCVPTDTVMAQWRSNVWTALYNAGQSQFYAQQQTTSAQISALKNQINNADTLTLRREENDEIMKCVLRSLLAPTINFAFMPANVVAAFTAAAANAAGGNPLVEWLSLYYGVDFTGNQTVFSNYPQIQAADWSIVSGQEQDISLIRQSNGRI